MTIKRSLLIKSISFFILFTLLYFFISKTDSYISFCSEINEEIALKAIKSGNNKLYNVSSYWFLNSKIPENFVCYSIAMAMRHNYNKAYYDTYYIYSHFYKIEGDKESPFYNFILYNLAMAYELGYEIDDEEIGDEIVTEDNIKSSEYYLSKAYPEYD